MKKFFSLLLLAVLFINISGYHFMFWLQRSEIRLAMKKTLSLHLRQDGSESFVFLLNEKNTAERPEWKGGDEFELKGEMYDVLEKKIVDGKMIVKAINDKKETQLVKKYLAMSRDDFGNSRKKSVTLLKLISGLYTSPEVTDNTLVTPVKPVYFPVDHYNITSPGCDVLTPPPQVS